MLPVYPLSKKVLSTKGQGFITDWEKALHDALRKTTGLRCFNHFRRNCKNKLTTWSLGHSGKGRIKNSFSMLFLG